MAVVAVVGMGLGLFHFIYLVGFMLTGFADYSSMAVLPWLILIAVCLLNLTLFRLRKSPEHRGWRYALLLLSILSSATMIWPILYVVLGMGEAVR